MHPPSEFRRRLGAYTLVSLLALVAWSSQGDSIVLNGSFENGEEQWVTSAEGARVILAGDGAADGAFVLELDMPSGGIEGLALQNLALEPGREYELSYRYQRSFAEKKLQLPVTLHEYTPLHAVSRANMFSTVPDVAAPVSDGWETQSVRFFASHSQSPLQFGPIVFPNDPVEGGRVWIDDIELTALGTFRAPGVDHDFFLTLPSEAVVGEPVEAHIACFDVRGKQDGWRVRGMPVSTDASMAVITNGSSATAPGSIQFNGEVQQTFTVTFQSPGIQRLRLSHANGHVRLSNPVRVVASELPKRSFWGDLHIHTQYNHGGWVSGDGFQNYAYARDIARLDFAGLSEHFPGSVALPYVRQMSDATELFNEPGRFATFFASERGMVEGHHNTYLRGDDRFAMADPRYQKFDTLRQAFDFYRSQGTPMVSIPHHFALLDPTDWRLTDRDARTVVELYSDHGSSEVAGEWWRHPDHDGNNYEDTMGAEGHDYLAALERGHRLGVIAASDDHFARPGIEGLACVSAPQLGRTEIWDEMQARHCYATSGARMLMDFSVDGVPMGDEHFAPSGTPLSASLRVSGTAPIEAIEIVSAGEVVYSAAPNSLDFANPSIDLGLFEGQTSYFYVRVRQTDEHRGWSSPVWVYPPKPDLSLETKDVSYDYGSQTLTIAAQNHGDGAAEASVRVFSSERHAALELNQLLGDEMGVVANVLPMSDERALVEFYLYIPTSYNEVFDFSGAIQLTGATGYSVITDPRGMLVDEGAGRVTWDEGPYGYKPIGSGSHSGRVTDFALLVETTDVTQLGAILKANDVPIAECFVGTQLSGIPGSLSIDLGIVAPETEMAEETVLVSPGSPSLVTVPGAAPGRTYVVVIDPDDDIEEVEEHNNACAVAVAALEPQFEQWSDIPKPPPLPALEVKPATSGIAFDSSRQLRAVATYPGGETVDATHAAQWNGDPHFGSVISVQPDGRVLAAQTEASARISATLELGNQSVVSDDAIVWATGRTEPVVLTAGYSVSYLDEGNPSQQPLFVTARVAQRDNFVDGVARVGMLNSDGSFWAPYGAFVLLRDDGGGADVVAGDGTFTAIVLPAPQSDAALFEPGENFKTLTVEYLTQGQSFSNVTPWPFHLEGAEGDYPQPANGAPLAAPDDVTFLGPRVLSAGTRGFAGQLPGWGGGGAATGPGGAVMAAQAGDPEYVFLEVQVSPPLDPVFAGAPTRVVARLPWSSSPVVLRPSQTVPDLHHLLIRTHPSLLPDGLHRIDVRAETYLPFDDGESVQEWWPSDWWPQLRLHDFLGDE